MTLAPITMDVAEDWLEAHMRRWFQDYLGVAVASGSLRNRLDAADVMPLTWGRADDWNVNLDYEGHYLPAVFIVSEGTNGDASYDEGLRFEGGLFTITVVAEDQRGGDVVIGCNVTTRLYEFALRNLFLGQKSITESIRVEDVLGTRLSSIPERGLAFAEVQLAAAVCTASTDPDWLDDPVFGSPPRTPDELVPAEQINIVTEPA